MKQTLIAFYLITSITVLWFINKEVGKIIEEIEIFSIDDIN